MGNSQYTIPVSMTYVDRGNLSSPDFTEATFTEDGTWRDLDLSSIVPLLAKLVLLTVSARCNNAGKNIKFRKKGYADSYNACVLATNVVGLPIAGDFLVPIDAAGKIQYYFSSATGWDTDVSVKGWFV